ncbi:response regulator transcription factor [Terricaulis sp.]|uniref:response regulator transcription factor n=1 Tax=Terricaulis sp. TaxID=2768686 RepID=UPI003784FA00
MLKPDQPLLVLVDDDDSLLAALKFAFETEGFGVASYCDAESVLASPPATRPACYIVDLKLPGLSGVGLIESLRLSGETAPAVLITTHPDRVTNTRARMAGAEIVEKPLDDDVLRRKVASLIARPLETQSACG